MNTTIMENRMVIPQKSKPSIPLPGLYPKEVKSASQRDSHTPTFTAAAKSLQSCPTLGDPIDGSPAGSPVPGILQATTLEWVAISFCNA